MESLPRGESFNDIVVHDGDMIALNNEKKVIESALDVCRSSYARQLGTTVSFRHLGKEHFLLEVGSDISTTQDFLAMSRTKTHVRYWTREVKELAIKHDEVSEKIRARSECVFREFLVELCRRKSVIEELMTIISELDCLQSIAKFSATLGCSTCLPSFSNGHEIILNVKDMRHPFFSSEKQYISNSVEFSHSNHANVMVLTGPNMGGKSTFMKQLALNVILAQIGSYVPSSQYFGTLFSRILTRIGIYLFYL